MKPRVRRLAKGAALVASIALSPVLLSAAETEKPPLPAGYTLVYQQDFAGEFSTDDFVFTSPDHWKRVKVGGGFALEHRNAGSKGYQPPHRSPYNIALVRGRRLGSFILEYDVQQTGRAYGHRDACVFFNFIDPANYYYTHVATKSDPHAHQIMLVDDAPRRAITAKGTKGFDWGKADQWHHVRVERDLESGRIEIYVDDMSQPIMQAVDKTHGAGYLGFGSFDDSGRVTNIRVFAAEVEARPAKFFKGKAPSGS